MAFVSWTQRERVTESFDFGTHRRTVEARSSVYSSHMSSLKAQHLLGLVHLVIIAESFNVVTTGCLCPSSSSFPEACQGTGVHLSGGLVRPNLMLLKLSSISQVLPPETPFASTDFQCFVRHRKSITSEVVLDLRSKSDFRTKHLLGSTSIPVDDLEPKLLELPPPFDGPVSLLGKQEVSKR